MDSIKRISTLTIVENTIKKMKELKDNKLPFGATPMGMCEFIAMQLFVPVNKVDFDKDIPLNRFAPPKDEWYDEYYWFPLDEEGYRKRVEVLIKLKYYINAKSKS